MTALTGKQRQLFLLKMLILAAELEPEDDWRVLAASRGGSVAA